MEDPIIQELIDKGLVKPNSDGTYDFTDEGAEIYQRMIKDHPELYPQIFPDRMN